MDEIPPRGSHLAIQQEELDLNKYKPSTNLEAMEAHFAREVSEIVVMVEGIDPLTSGSFCAVHSYRKEDIVWHKTAVFHPCITAEKDSYTIDLDRFHQIIKTAGGRQQQLSIRPHDMFFNLKDRRILRTPSLNGLRRKGTPRTSTRSSSETLPDDGLPR